MADKKKSKNKISDKFKKDEEGYEAILDDEELEDIPDESLDEGIPPEELFDSTGRGVIAPDREYPDILDADVGLPPVTQPKGREPLRRPKSSPGSVLSQSEKTTGYTPSEGETFTFDRTGQMVVPEGRKVEEFAPGVRKHLDRLDRRGADPKGSRPTTPRTKTGSSALPKSPISAKFQPSSQPTTPPEPLSNGVDARYRTGLPPDPKESELGEEAAKPPIPIDSRYSDPEADAEAARRNAFGIPMEGEVKPDTLGEIPTMGADPKPNAGQASSQGGGGDPSSPWYRPVGKGQQSINQAGVIPQEATHTVQETRSRTDVDPGYKSKWNELLGEMGEDKRRGYENIEGAVQRSFAQGKKDEGEFKSDRDKLLDNYSKGLDKIDRRKFIDTIAGNLGKVVSGGIGLGFIPTPGVLASAPLNVAKYYEYDKYDPTSDVAAQKGRFDAGFQLQKEKEAARKEGRESEVKAYETLEKYRSEMTDKQMGKVMEMLQLTKQAVNLGYTNVTESIFNEKFMADLMKQDRETQMKYVEMATDILKAKIGADAAGRVRDGMRDRPPNVEVGKLNTKRMDEMKRYINNLTDSYLPNGASTKQQLQQAIDKYYKELERDNWTEGNVERNDFTNRVLNKVKEWISTIPDGAVVQDPKSEIREFLSDTENLVDMQVIEGGSVTKYDRNNPVLKIPLSSAQLPEAGKPPPRPLAPAKPTKPKYSIWLDPKTNKLMNVLTKRPVQNRQELDALIAEDKRNGFNWPNKVYDYVK